MCQIAEMPLHDPVTRLDAPASGVLRLTLSRPERRNAITAEVTAGMAAALDRAAQDDGVRALVVRGAGDRAFSAGYDIDELVGRPNEVRQQLLLDRERLLWRLLTVPVPVVAAVDGAAYGGGAMWAMCADVRVGSPRTSFRFAAVRYGGVALTWLLDSLVGGAWARDLLLSGRAVEADEARRIGLVTRWSEDPGHAEDLAVEVAAELAALPVAAVRGHKDLLLRTWGRSFRERYDLELVELAELLDSRPADEMFAPFLARRAQMSAGPG